MRVKCVLASLCLILGAVFSMGQVFTRTAFAANTLTPEQYQRINRYDGRFYFPGASGLSLSGCGNEGTGLANLVGGDNTEKIWSFFISKGLNATQTAAIMGNFQKESGNNSVSLQPSTSVNPTVHPYMFTTGINDTDVAQIKSLIGGRGFGLGQWTDAGRQNNLINFARSHNVSMTDLSMQLSFTWQEMNDSNSDKSVSFWDITGTTTSDIQAATISFHDWFERSADTEAMKSQRANYATQFFGLYSGLDITSLGGANGCGYVDNAGFYHYLQKDPQWGNFRIGGETIGGVGCYITSIAMTVSTLSGRSITPPQVAEEYLSNGGWFGSGGGADSGHMPTIVGGALGLRTQLLHPSSNNLIETVNKALGRGALVIAGGARSVPPFTSNQHWVVIRGIENGKWLVANPEGEARELYDPNNMHVAGANLGSNWTIVEK